MTATQPETAGPSRRPIYKRWPFWVSIAAVVAVVAIVLVVVLTHLSFTVSGSLAINGAANIAYTGQKVGADDQCTGQGQYSGFEEGAPITITGAPGRVVATGTLDKAISLGVGLCVWGISIQDVPPGAGPYVIEIAQQPFGTFTEDQLRKGPELEVGN